MLIVSLVSQYVLVAQVLGLFIIFHLWWFILKRQCEELGHVLDSISYGG